MNRPLAECRGATAEACIRPISRATQNSPMRCLKYPAVPSHTACALFLAGLPPPPSLRGERWQGDLPQGPPLPGGHWEGPGASSSCLTQLVPRLPSGPWKAGLAAACWPLRHRPQPHSLWPVGGLVVPQPLRAPQGHRWCPVSSGPLGLARSVKPATCCCPSQAGWPWARRRALLLAPCPSSRDGLRGTSFKHNLQHTFF